MSFLNRKAYQLIGKSAIQVAGIFQQSILPAAVNSTTTSIRTINRSLAVLSTPSSHSNQVIGTSSNLCSCGCSRSMMHTRGDRELVEFLQDEIISEKKNQAEGGKITSTLEEFSVKGDRGEICLEKKFHDEQVSITLNVNHTVEPDSPPPMQGEQETPEKEEEGDMSSRPDFEVDVKIGNRTLSFTCQFTTPTDITEGEQVEDNFSINEVTFFEGEHNEKTYCVAGEILDGMLYDLLMNYLEERGISSEFVEKLSDLCTSYEHNQYIGLLEHMQDFVKRK